VSLEVLTTLKIMNDGIKCWELVPRYGVITDQHAFNEQKKSQHMFFANGHMEDMKIFVEGNTSSPWLHGCERGL